LGIFNTNAPFLADLNLLFQIAIFIFLVGGVSTAKLGRKFAKHGVLMGTHDRWDLGRDARHLVGGRLGVPPSRDQIVREKKKSHARYNPVMVSNVFSGRIRLHNIVFALIGAWFFILLEFLACCSKASLKIPRMSI
jgi:hypothetical protein